MNIRIISLVLQFLFLIVFLLISVAYFTVWERKVLSSIQRRQGPNVVGIYGFTQALRDGLKLLLKEGVLPTNSNRFLFLFAPLLRFSLALLIWVVVPMGNNLLLSDLPFGILYIFSISSLGVYGVLIAGWSSNRNYAFLGALRSAAQIISYEISIGFIFSRVIICCGSLNLRDIIEMQQDIWLFFPLLPVFFIFLVSILAETNRHPFDLPEAEAELVAGYNVEYSSIRFALFFLGEYRNMIVISVLVVVFFFGGWSSFSYFRDFSNSVFGVAIVSFKTLFFIFFFIWARAAYPRYRYDQLISIGWKAFLPLSLRYLLIISSIFFRLDGFCLLV